MKVKSVGLLFGGMFIALGLFAAGCGALQGDSTGSEQPREEALLFDTDELYGECRLSNLRDFSGAVLEIPEFYQGKKVVEIGRLSGDASLDEIEKIVLPQSVKKIGNYVFYGMSNLAEIVVSDEAVLEHIGDQAFANCSSLTEYALPATVKTVGEEAFIGCSALTEFTVGANAESIGINTFLGCEALTAINVDAENLYYSSRDGVLFDKDKIHLIEYPYGKTTESYTVPATVSEIGTWAFFGNKTLRTIDLNQAIMVRKYAFAECSNLTAISADKIKYAEIGVVEETPWLNNKTNDFIMLGGALLEYRGSAKAVSLERAVSISPFAFAENKNLKSITIDNTLSRIDDRAFYKCENLSAVYMNNTNRMVVIGKNVFGRNAADRKIYVPRNLYDKYKKDVYWKQYFTSLAVHQTTIKFNGNGGSACADGSVEYLGYVGELPVPEKEGYKFLGWYDNPDFAGKKIDTGLSWDSMEAEVTLYAKYEEKKPIVYPINYHPNGGTIAVGAVHTYTAEDDVILPTATKSGYEFKGWYYDEEFTRPAGSGWKKGETGIKYLYAKWEAVK